MKRLVKAVALIVSGVYHAPTIAETPATTDDSLPAAADQQSGELLSVVAHPWLNFRVGPSRRAPVLDVLPRGTRLLMRGLHGDYAEVERIPQGTTGYVAARYLLPAADDGSVAALEPVTTILEQRTPVAADLPDSRENHAGPQPSAEVVQGDKDQQVLFGGLAVTESAPATGPKASHDAAVTMANPGAGPWYLAADVGYAQGNVTADDLRRSLQEASSSVNIRHLDESSVSWLLALGYRWTRNWAFELGLMDLGAYDSVIEIRNAEEAAVRTILARHHPVGGTGIRLAAVGQLQIRGISLSAAAGIFLSSDTTVEVILDSEKVTVDGEDISTLLEVGAGYGLKPNWEAQLFVSHLDLNQQVLNSGLRLRYAF